VGGRRGRREYLAEEVFHRCVGDSLCLVGLMLVNVLREFKGELKLVCRLSTRCRDTEGGVASVVATRARWRVDSDSATSNSKSNELPDRDVWDDAGEMGNIDELGTMTGNGEGDRGESAVVVSAEGRAGIPVGSPWASRALTTASQPFSSVLIRSLSSSFSLSRILSRSSSSSTGLRADETGISNWPALNRLFSSSSSATRCSRWV
jgi:hypothetical protein